MRRLGGSWWLCLWRIIELGELRGRIANWGGGTVDLPSFWERGEGREGKGGYRSKRARYLPFVKGREGKGRA